MKKLFLVLGLAVVLLASCCNNNNQKGAQKCDAKQEQKCDGHNHDHKCDGHNHDGATCEKKCDGQKPEACKGDHQNCEKKCDGQKPEAKAECQGHQHAGCNHQHGAAH